MTGKRDIEPRSDKFLQLQREVESLHKQVTALSQIVGQYALRKIQVFPFDIDCIPERQTDGAVGLDARLRAIVDKTHKPDVDNHEHLRRTMADFKKTPGWEDRVDPSLIDYVREDPDDPKNRYAIALPPWKWLMAGLGIATAFENPFHIKVVPRSGLASRGLILANPVGIIDSDYRGEAGALLLNISEEEHLLFYRMRCVQYTVETAFLPELDIVQDINDLGVTERSVGGFGSTGEK